jgi:hypothetical protein
VLKTPTSVSWDVRRDDSWPSDGERGLGSEEDLWMKMSS